MYFATDITEIQAAMEATAPRPIRDVILEYYPDCTIDRNNRAHAPYDGYECQFTGKQFRAGEYLPFEPSEEDALRPGKAVRRLWVFCDGETYSFEATKAQVAAGAEVAKRQAAEFDSTKATHVGELKKRADLKLRLLGKFVDFGYYGPEITHFLRDENNNPVVYKGAKSLKAELGEFIEIKATIKAHWTARDGSRKATYINRPTVAG
jgi:hypothetical protein